MALVTRNVANGIAPRVHEPKGKTKAKAKGKASTSLYH